MIGVGIGFDAHDSPHFTFEIEMFSLSEAVSYFEYTLDVATRAQRDSDLENDSYTDN
jgi:hypothetical protein